VEARAGGSLGSGGSRPGGARNEAGVPRAARERVKERAVRRAPGRWRTNAQSKSQSKIRSIVSRLVSVP
jgi:hypothetical protein